MAIYSVEDIKKEYLSGKSLRYSQTKDQHIYNFIELSITLSISHKEKVYCFINNYKPSCPICGEIPRFNNFVSGYNETCSRSCSVKYNKTKIENTKIKNIQEQVKHLSPHDIVDGLYNNTLKIANWRNIDKLTDYTHFRTLKQLYKHIVLGEDQTCEFCGNLLDFDKKAGRNRKCNCLTKEEKMIQLLPKNIQNEDFIKWVIEKKLHYNLQYKKHNEILTSEYIKRTGDFLKFTNSLNEDMYCKLHKITSKQNNDFIDLNNGYKKEVTEIDFSKSNEEILYQLTNKYSKKGVYQAIETKDWINNKMMTGNTVQEKIYLLFNKRTYCEVCGKKTSFDSKIPGYKKYCSISCVNKGESVCRTESKRIRFKNNQLPMILDEMRLDILEDYTEIKHIYKMKCRDCENIFYGNLGTSTSICRVCNPKISGVSYKEKSIIKFIKTFYNGEIKENYRAFGKEFDIFIPDKNLAIEFNGLYWHSDQFKKSDYHLNKTILAEENGLQLLHIFEDEWDYKKDIVCSTIKSKLGFSEKIFARKCKIKKISSKESNNFLESNHLQGKDNSPIRFGLFYENELVSVLTFKRSHRSKDKYLELKRFASKLGTNVVGGFSKLFKHASWELNEDIVTFADRRYSSSINLYTKNGFKLNYITKPNYYYNINGRLESREKYQKHKLIKILNTFDSNLTEKENMQNNGYYRVFDSGNYKYTYAKI